MFVSACSTEGGQAKKDFFWPFCTFWTRVAMTAPRRPKRTNKPGSRAVWVLQNQPSCGFCAPIWASSAPARIRCMVPICARFKARKVPLGGEATRVRSGVPQPPCGRKRGFRSRTEAGREGVRQQQQQQQQKRCGELAAKTAILGGFSRPAGASAWVAAEGHSGSTKRSLRARPTWKKRGNGPVASACDAKTHRNFSLRRRPRENKRFAADPRTRNLRQCGPRTTRLFARAVTCAPKHQKPTKNIARAQRDSNPQPPLCANMNVIICLVRDSNP